MFNMHFYYNIQSCFLNIVMIYHYFKAKNNATKLGDKNNHNNYKISEAKLKTIMRKPFPLSYQCGKKIK